MADYWNSNPYNGGLAGIGYNPYNQYQPMNQQNQFIPQLNNNQRPQQIQQQNTFQWVQGQAAAEAFLVAPGNSVILMDSNAPVIYYKSADANGRYLPMKTYDLVERSAEVEQARTQPQQIDTSSFVKRDEIAGLIEQEIERQLAAPSK